MAGDFKPLVPNRGPIRFCGHVHQDSLTGGWVVDCHNKATFIRTAPDGGHDYACSSHVQEMAAEVGCDG